MTDKTRYAMFAMVTAVVFSLGIMPSLQSAHALTGIVSDTETVLENQTNFYDARTHSNACGTGNDVHLESTSYVQDSIAGDVVSVSYDFSDCSGPIDTVHIVVSKGLATLATFTTSTMQGTHSFIFNADEFKANDNITITVNGNP